VGGVSAAAADVIVAVMSSTGMDTTPHDIQRTRQVTSADWIGVTERVSRRCHKSWPTERTASDNHEHIFAAKPSFWTHRDTPERTESTSQAEYAGSIPVIGSTLTSDDSVERRFGRRGGTYPIPTAGRGRWRVRAHKRSLWDLRSR
jgi:hypothetical protein